MTLFIWIDENGNWRVSHFPPEGEHVLMCCTAPEGGALFLDMSDLSEVTVETGG